MRRGVLVGAIAAIYILPFALVAGGVVPVEFRRWLYVLAGVVALGVAWRVGLSLRSLGIRWDNVRIAWLPYAVFAVVGIPAIVAVALADGRHVREAWWTQAHFQGIFIPVSLAQELFYRSILIPLLALLTNRRWVIILANATLFAFLHIIFPDPVVVLPLTFLAGLVFAALWLRWPNLWLASAAHVVLNVAFTLFCFGGFDGSCSAT